MDDKLRIAIAVPYYNLVPVPFHMSLVTLITKLKEWGIGINLFSIDRTNCVMARNTLAKLMLESHTEKPYDWFFHIDSDTVFRPDQFLRLIRDAELYHVNILSGLYMQRGINHADSERHPVVLRKVNGKYSFINMELKENINHVDAVGFGFMVCRPVVYEDIKKKHEKFIFEYAKTSEDMLSEDVVWCERAKEAGYNIYVDKDVVVGHYGII